MKHRLALMALLTLASCVSGTEPLLRNPLPAVTSVEPASVVPASGPVVLTVRGRDFVPGARVEIDGSLHDADVQSETLLQTTLGTDGLSVGVTLSVVVVNPEPGGGASGATTVYAAYPPPAVDSVLPGSAVAIQEVEVAIDVYGEGFSSEGSGTLVVLDGVALPTQVVSSGHLRATMGAPFLRTARTWGIAALNPAPGGGRSTAVPFSVTHPVPVIDSVLPDSVTRRTAAEITVHGFGFAPGATVWMDTVEYTPSELTEGRLTFSYPNSEPERGGGRIQVSVPSPGGGLSNVDSVGVREKRPVIRQTGPEGLEIGVAGGTLEVIGDDFAPDAVVRLDGAARPTTFVADGRLAINIGSADVDSLGTLEIVVENPRGGGPSDPVEVAVLPVGRVAYTWFGDLLSSRLNEEDVAEVDVERSPDWIDTTPSGDQIIYTIGFRAGLYAGVPGGPVDTITTMATKTPRMSDDGVWIYFGDPEIWRIHPDGTGLEAVLTGPPPGVLNRWPEPSPDGTELLVARYTDNAPGDRDDLLIVDLATGAETSLGVPAQDSRWSPTGDWIAFRDRFSVLWLIRPDGTDQRQLLGGRVVSPGTFDWSPDGRYLFVGGRYGQVIDVVTDEVVDTPIEFVGYVSWFADPS